MKYNPRQLHLQHKLSNADIEYSIILKYSKTLKEWEFSAWKCQHCDHALKFASSVVKHKSTCKKLNTIKKKKTDD